MVLGVGLGILFWLLLDNVAFFPLWVSIGLVMGTALASQSSDGGNEPSGDDGHA